MVSGALFLMPDGFYSFVKSISFIEDVKNFHIIDFLKITV